MENNGALPVYDTGAVSACATVLNVLSRSVRVSSETHKNTITRVF